MESRGVALAIIILLLASLGVFWIGMTHLRDENNPPLDSTTTYFFDWPVNVGDTFTYQIIVTGGVYWDWGDEGSPPLLVEYNETNIHAEVIYLPENTTSLDNGTILNKIIMPIKFNCTFANSSLIPEPVNSRITELLSWSLIPSNCWSLINECFYENRFIDPFDFEDQKICEAILDDAMLNLSISVQKDWLHAIGEKWECSVSRLSGLPSWMTYCDYSFSCIGSGYRTIITLYPSE
jgi:hypothetical protein